MAKKCDNLAYHDNVLLNEIIYNAYDSIFVTDREGTILLANQASSKHLNISLEELIGANCRDLIKQGYYNRSTALEAAESKRTVTGIVKSLNGLNLMATSAPLFDQEGNVTMVITNSRDKDAMERFLVELGRERDKAERYKNEVEHLRLKYSETGVVAKSQLMRDVLLKANMIAPTDSSVMIYGESGTGKDVIAQYIHHRSNRNNGPFITVNCAAIPENLIESELFGYEKGAFTGAGSKGKPGLFEIADKGTIFLDEIAEMPLALQPKLLRVLESSELRRVGDTFTRRVNVRVIGATNKNLKEMIMERRFRDDLYYRLNVIPIKIAPLRDRPSDILALAEIFLDEFNKKYNCSKVFGKDTMDSFVNYRWPGNVRELRNVVERLAIITADNYINSRITDPLLYENNVPAEHIISDNITSLANAPAFKTLKEATEVFQEQYIKTVLNQCNNSIGETSQKLGIHRSGLYKKLHKKVDSSSEND